MPRLIAPPARRVLVLLIVFAISALSLAQSPATAHNFVDSVYPFLGVDWGGNTFVGAALPFGMVKVGPDMESFDGRQSGFGYTTDGRILGFSQTHLSGAQGKYGNILIMPVTGALALDDIRSPRTAEINHPGYYATRLTRYHDFVELTSTRRVALHRYTFSTAADAHITVNISHCLGKGSGSESQRFISGEVHFVSDREIAGVGRYAGGWNKGGEYTVYFDMLLDTPAMSTRTWTGATITSSQQASVDRDIPLGATFDLPVHAGEIVQAKLAISFISIDQARATLEQETSGRTFDSIRATSSRIWNEALSKIQIHGETDAKRIQFYTAMYHTMLMPTDRTGENPDWQSSEPYYDDYYAIWDTYRSSGPLAHTHCA